MFVAAAQSEETLEDIFDGVKSIFSDATKKKLPHLRVAGD